MKRSYKVLLSAFVLLLAGLVAARGQASPALDRLEVVFWPEYDQPALLVMLRGWLPADAPMPTYVPIPIPAGVTPSAVAKRDANGSLLLAAHTIIDHRFHRELRVMADTPEIRVEYYAPLTLSGEDRTYVFSWPGGLSVETVKYEIQQPVGATALSMVPPAEQQSTGFDGLTYYSADLGSKSAAETFEVRLTYSKASSELTRDALQVTTSPTTGAIPQPRQSPQGGFDDGIQDNQARDLPWLIVIPLLLIAALLVAWFRLSGADS